MSTVANAFYQEMSILMSFFLPISALSNCTHVMPDCLLIRCKWTNLITSSAPFVKPSPIFTFMGMSVPSPSARCKTVYNRLVLFGWLYGIRFNLFSSRIELSCALIEYFAPDMIDLGKWFSQIPRYPVRIEFVKPLNDWEDIYGGDGLIKRYTKCPQSLENHTLADWAA